MSPYWIYSTSDWSKSQIKFSDWSILLAWHPTVSICVCCMTCWCKIILQIWQIITQLNLIIPWCYWCQSSSNVTRVDIIIHLRLCNFLISCVLETQCYCLQHCCNVVTRLCCCLMTNIVLNHVQVKDVYVYHVPADQQHVHYQHVYQDRCWVWYGNYGHRCNHVLLLNQSQN